MLQAIREKTQGIIAAILLGMVGIPFALWGVNHYFSGGATDIVAKVNGTEISRTMYDRRLNDARLRLRDPQQLENKQFRKQLVQQMIRGQLLIQDARDLGFVVGDRLLQQLLAERFQTNGRFDRRRYDTYLANIGTTAVAFEASIRQGGVVEQLKSGFQESAFVTGRDRKDVIRLLTQARTFSYLLVPTGTYTKRVKISEDDIKAYYTAHPEEFRTTEKVQVEYVVLSIKDLAKKYTPTEDEIRAEYEANKSSYTTRGKRRASHILIELPLGTSGSAEKKVLAKIKQVQQKLRAGVKFSTLARRYSDDTLTAKRGGDLKTIKPGVLPKELEAAIYKLKPGQVSKPVRTKYGYHIIKLTGYVPDKITPFRKVKTQLAKQIALQWAEKRFNKLNSEFNNLVYEQPESLQPVSEALGLKIHKSGWFTRNGGKGLMANPKIIAAAYSKDVLQERRNSETIDIGSDKVIALRLAGYREAKTKPLDQVRGLIRSKLRNQRAHKMAVSAGEKILTQIRAGTAITALARQQRLKLIKNVRVTRTKTKKINQGIINAVFKAGKPKGNKPLYGGADLGATGYVVFVLTRVSDGDPGKADPIVRTLITRRLLQRRGIDYYRYYQQGVEQRADITIYDKQL